MIIIKEERLENFEFWSGACYVAEKLTSDEFDVIEELLQELYPDGMTEIQVNDFSGLKATQSRKLWDMKMKTT